ncbi:Mob1/phocein [Coniochaeta ligniaria NRRL 30616]|uniref:Mob1/phocein n=1 Tax=Coniochaeta ligniaria NRRL 30616 TaxID=1408157 RepID=A0A1J7JGC0_9PEZI|nr:Mob1/phocein [Coniochaeta ligniaria NRRL 30616]
MAMPSSPRLPSPPPPAEIQIGPKSPSMGPNALQAQQIEQTQIDAAAKRRIHPGTKAADMAAGPPLIPLNELDSAFQLQEHLAALHYYHTRSNTVPITRETAKLLATPPPTIDRTLWLYELCRFLIAQCNSLIVGFLFDTPPCSAATCPEMRASEWQFLCAVHDAPKSCCAIDYCCHTLDWAANVVTNPKIFPSRFVAPPSGDGHDKGAALKNLVNVFRRLHRIFAHAWFQHRGVFWSVEGQTGLYVFFKTVCDLYDLLPAENYKLPPEAEGLEAPTAAAAAAVSEAGGDKKHQAGQHQVVTSIASRPPSAVERGAGGQASLDDDFNSAAARTNTRRHIRSNPSTGNAISMVPEVDEDDAHAAGLAGKLKELSLSSAAAAASQPPPPSVPAVEEQHTESEVADVPVIVLDEGNASPARRERETKVETKETTETEDEEGAESEKREEQEPVKEEQPSEAEPASVVLENELEKPVPEPSVETAEEPTAHPEPAEGEKEEDESEDVGDETVMPSDDDDKAEPAETETAPEEVEEEHPPVSAIQSKDFEDAVAKEDPAAAATVAAASDEKEDVSEEKIGKDEETVAGHADKPKEEKASEDESKAEADEKD